MRNEGHRVRAFAANFPQFHNGPLTLCAPKVRNAAAELPAAHRSGRARNVKR